MASTEQQFLALLRSDRIQDGLFAHLSTGDACAVRQSSSACCNLLTKRLFTRIHVTFTASAFTKPCRVAALGRIGHHVEHLTFYLPHSDATFLPPLVHPQTGQEISFLYTPHTSMGSALTRPKYANTELGDILTQQYPPLFHAATNVPSFIQVLGHFARIRHLTVRCPGQNPAERYRRDIVDYALISLRIAVERAPLTNLHKLSLSSLHPAALSYLRHVNGIGSVPSAGRRWKQIRKLHLSVEAWDFHNSASPGLDHLKIIDDYIRGLAPQLEKLSFSWIGARGPCPIALAADPLFAPPRASRKLFHEVTSPMSPLPVRPPRAPIHMPALRYLQIRNTAMNAPQLRRLIDAHQATVKEYDFENVSLADNGRWDDALAPVSEEHKWSHSGLVRAPSRCSLATSESADDELPSLSAAVAAVGRELLDMDFGAYGFDDDDDDEKTVMEEELTVEMAAAGTREESTGFTTRIRKKKRSKHNHRGHDQDHHRSKRKHSRSASEPDHKSKPPPPPPLPRSHSSSSQPSSLSPMRLFRRPSHSSSSSSSSQRKLSLETIHVAPVTLSDPFISPPILSSEPQPVLLQPTVYDPHARHAAVSPGVGDDDDGITAVQRNLEQEEAHRLLAEDAAARVSALQRAKEAVMTKLTREFFKKHKPSDGVSGHYGHDSAGPSNGAVAACRLMAGRDLVAGSGSYYYTGNSDFVLEDRCTMDSQTAMVPLMLSRA
ncbi:uncharacterized protein BBA_06114 [Beauveria bassiana ARSEF 2860]|uniref:Uncharacterized protein n=1 Tax=Beauveria bassiana (strain ARSEF 2860) TaxID=655819 RepID=J4KN20_BEAB2|nr:uncharacterized protein BBA_06114 [Beauveria bassiana ARSEF 2860]EJP64939.1 hypothetical protein BBA_06114 [Beauveria bassiana ARSEF 2860]